MRLSSVPGLVSSCAPRERATAASSASRHNEHRIIGGKLPTSVFFNMYKARSPFQEHFVTVADRQTAMLVVHPRLSWLTASSPLPSIDARNRIRLLYALAFRFPGT